MESRHTFFRIQKSRGFLYVHDNQLYKQVERKGNVLYLKCCVEVCDSLIHRTCFVRQPFPCSLMFDNCLCYMHRSKSFAIVFRPHPNLAYHTHGPSKSTTAIWSVKIQVRQNPPSRFGPPKSSPSNSGLWSFLVLQIPGPANSVTPWNYFYLLRLHVSFCSCYSCSQDLDKSWKRSGLALNSISINEQESPAVAREDMLQPIQFLLQCWPSRSSKVNDFYLIWKGIFLLVINSNLGTISHHFSDPPPPFNSELENVPLGLDCWNFACLGQIIRVNVSSYDLPFSRNVFVTDKQTDNTSWHRCPTA